MHDFQNTTDVLAMGMCLNMVDQLKEVEVFLDSTMEWVKYQEDTINIFK
jgi:hypothetical protein